VEIIKNWLVVVSSNSIFKSISCN